MNELRHTPPALPDGDVVERDGIAWVSVPRTDRMPPFLVSVVSPSDHWLYLSTGGGLAAGRVDPESCLFPYVTDDLLHRGGQGGSVTTIRLTRRGKKIEHTCLTRCGEGVRWRPFRDELLDHGRRDLLKSVEGDRVRLIERRDDLGAECMIEWAFSEPHGIVRRLRVTSDEDATIELLDGIDGVLPAGVHLAHMQATSCLVDAYRRAERVRDDLAVFSLESKLSDRAEPAESLRATTVFGIGYGSEHCWLSRDAIAMFDAGAVIEERHPWTGAVGCFLMQARWELSAGVPRDAFIVADVQRTQHDVVALRNELATGAVTLASMEAELTDTTRALDDILYAVDGLQRTGDAKADAHHRSNALFNAMRGGVFDDGHRVPPADLRRFVGERNRACSERVAAWFDDLGHEPMLVDELRDAAERCGDADVQRLVLEYLPIWFGRRHGDPSRPWNRFAIRVKNPDGSRRLTYQGNWRDIFQNWEALLATHSEFLDHVIAKFVNASTLDGFNPYRITSEGIDWEEPEPDNPWANIGYWGDHQIPYLSRLLLLSRELHGRRLARWINEQRFSSADVPYTLCSVQERMADPRHTITFDVPRHEASMARVHEMGADGRLVPDEAGGVLHVGFGEKLLVPVLCKLSHFVPGGGVWMNTQRPEWNDANNALAGYGLSMVTVCQLRRHLDELELLFRGAGTVSLSAPVATWLRACGALVQGPDVRAAVEDPVARRRAVVALGELYDRHAMTARRDAREPVGEEVVLALLGGARAALDATIAANRRADGLLHSYNLVRFTTTQADVLHLDEMLEGQVNLLASGALTGAEAADLLDALFASRLYRDDLGTFLLYPTKRLPGFLERNAVADGPGVDALDALADAGDRRIAWRDADGTMRFAPELESDRVLVERLREVPATSSDDALQMTVRERYEDTFHHHAFTGRSGTMYGYEGIGCTYWHMVGKLLLAALECHTASVDAGDDEVVTSRLAGAYERVRAGLGARMTASRFGAVPTDAYSHSPAHRGAQQPGMTGLVKEELVARRGELGVRVLDGQLRIQPSLIDPAEWSKQASKWTLPDGRAVDVPERALAFLFAGVPVVVRSGAAAAGAEVLRFDGSVSRVSGQPVLSAEDTRAILRRDGTIARIVVDCAG